MSIVKINSYININNISEEEALINAITLVNGYDIVNNNSFTEDVITKLYYIVPKLGKILVVVNDSDRDSLGIQDNVLANTAISDYPLVKLPANIIEYKELIVKKGSALTDAEVLNAAQAVADNTALTSLPYKIPVVKIINYNTVSPSQLVMPTIFNGNVFVVDNTNEIIVTNGDVTAGNTVLNKNIGLNLTIETKILQRDGTGGNKFGYSIALSDNNVVVGAPYDHTNGANIGSAYIYDMNGNELKLLQGINKETHDLFGKSVAISGNNVVIGAPNVDNPLNDCGSAYLYKIDNDQIIEINEPNKYADSLFGYSVDVSDNYILVSAPTEFISGQGQGGNVYLYNINGGYVRNIYHNNEHEGDYFGWSIALASDKIVVGAPHTHYRSENEGVAYIFNIDGSLQTELKMPDGGVNYEFGTTVSVSDTHIAVGAIGNSVHGTYSGAVYLFDINGTYLNVMYGDDIHNYTQFGTSLAITNDKIFVGTAGKDKVYIFDLEGNQIDVLVGTDTKDNDKFGYSLAVFNNHLAVGASQDPTSGSGAGSAYIYG